MHVGVIIDEQRLSQEQAMLNRLCIGLAGEGAQVTRIVPDVIESESILAGEQRMALLPRIEVANDVLPWTRTRRTERLASALLDSPPDVFYAVGQKAWVIGLDIAQAMQRQVLVDLWSMDQVRLVPRDRRLIAGYVVPTRAMAEALKRRVDPDRVHVVPLGVAAPRDSSPRPADDQSAEPTIAVIGGARDMPAYQAMLSGLSRVRRDFPSLQIFLELRGPHEHDIWQCAGRLGLHDAISAMSNASLYRSLLTHCDLMLIPERYGELRTLMLEAMALGAPIIASEETRLDPLVADQTGVFVRQNDPDAWAQQIRRVLGNADEARELGQRARQLVLAKHRSSDQVSELTGILQAIISPA